MSIFAAPSFYSQSDQDIYNRGNFFIPTEKFRGAFTTNAPLTTGTGGTTATTGINTIPFQQQQQDDDPGQSPFGPLEKTYLTESYDDLPDYMKEGGVLSFLPNRIRGQLGTRLQKQFDMTQKMPSIFAALAGMQSPFNPNSANYNRNIAEQLNYLEGEDGLIGRSSVGLKYGPESVLFGKNVISGFGTNDYEQALRDYITRMQNSRYSQEYKDKKAKQAQEELDKFLAKTTFKTGEQPGARTEGGGREVDTSRGAVAGAQQDISNYESFNEAPLADGGRVGYMMGGLTDLVDIYD